jgi:hypothetical protein
MIISDPTIVLDISLYDPYISPRVWLEAGVTDVIVKLGSGMCADAVALDLAKQVAPWLRLHAYWWDDPLYLPEYQINTIKNTIQKSGLQFLSVWLDMEQWWSNWNDWYLARRGQKEWSAVPYFNPGRLSEHFFSTNFLLRKEFEGGIYTGRGFITSWAPAMKNWIGEIGVPVWAAQYGRQPKEATYITWNEFKQKWLPDYDPDLSLTGIYPRQLWGHQFTGDKFMLPGAWQDAKHLKGNFMDVSIFSKAKMDSLGKAPIVPVLKPAPEPPKPVQYPIYQVRPQTRPTIRTGPTYYSPAWPVPLPLEAKLQIDDRRPGVYSHFVHYDMAGYPTEGWVWDNYLVKVA